MLADRPAASHYYVAADNPNQSAAATYDGTTARLAPTESGTTPSLGWVQDHWQLAERRASAWDASKHPVAEKLPFVLVLDEIQLVSQWSSQVKGLRPQNYVTIQILQKLNK